MQKSIPAQKATARVTKFQTQHLIEYGLKVLQTNLVSRDILSVRCQFCVYNGKESTLGEKCQCNQTQKIKDWQSPFHPSNYQSHHEGQHGTHWAEYQKLDYAGKKTYFDNKTKHKDTLFSHFEQPKKTHIIHYINAPIVDKIIGEMFFHPNDQDSISHATAIKLFKLDENDETIYTVTIKNIIQFHLTIHFLSHGISFRQAADLLSDTKQITGMANLGSLNATGVSNYACIVCAINLGHLSTILNDNSTWAFSLANDSSTHQGKSYLDNRIRFHRDGLIYNIHMLAIPMYDRHTGENMFKLVSDVFDIICPTWRTKLIGMGSDGASSMVGEYSGIVTHIEQEVDL